MTARPKVTLITEPIDWLLEALGVAALAWLILPVFSAWPDLPERVPTHFDFQGQPDGWGGRATLIGLPIVGGLLYLGMTLFGRFPRLHNFPFVINEVNVTYAYTRSVRMLRVLKILLASTFAIISQRMIALATDGTPIDNRWFLFAIGLTVAFPLVSMVLMIRGNRRLQAQANRDFAARAGTMG